MRKREKMRMAGEDADDSGCFVLQPYQQEEEPLLQGYDWIKHLQLMRDWRAALQLIHDWTRNETHFHSGQPWRQAFVFCYPPMSARTDQ